MYLNIKSYHKNCYAKRGILIQDKSPKIWLQEIQKMNFNLKDITVFAVPSETANVLYGCIVLISENQKIKELGKNLSFQLIENKIFVPEYSNISPTLTKEDWQNLFSENYYIFHNDIGWVELSEKVNWSSLFEISNSKIIEIRKPSKNVQIPKFITSFRIEIDEEKLAELKNPFDEQKFIEDLPFDMKKILKGNQKEIDKYLKFLEKNPEMALKHAIPLDTINSSRGGFGGSFSSENIISDFPKILKILLFILLLCFLIFLIPTIAISSKSVFPFIFFIFFIIRLLNSGRKSFSNSGGSFGKNALVDSERFNALRNQYSKLAEQYIKDGKYEKAAHIYMKLLKNYHLAASTLENGKMYQEAAMIYLKNCQNKIKAAECFENGKAYKKAIEIYKELLNHEKVGDLYLLLNDKKEAYFYFQKVIDEYVNNHQYVKAALIYRKKMNDFSNAQDILLSGWRSNKDAYNCLNNYFENIKNSDKIKININTIYINFVDASNAGLYVQVLKIIYKKHDDLKDFTKGLAYQIITQNLTLKPELLNDIKAFNPKNKMILKDIMKFKLNKSKVES